MRVRMLSVYCILEVKYCITGVNVYMDTLSIKTWLIFHTWQHFSALLIYHIAKEKKTKRFQIILAGTMCTFPISFYVSVCVYERVSVCESVSSLTVIFGFSGATRFVFCKKWIPKYWTFFFFLVLIFNVASTVFYFFPFKIGNIFYRGFINIFLM